jgi:hypothetical protein
MYYKYYNNIVNMKIFEISVNIKLMSKILESVKYECFETNKVNLYGYCTRMKPGRAASLI